MTVNLYKLIIFIILNNFISSIDRRGITGDTNTQGGSPLQVVTPPPEKKKRTSLSSNSLKAGCHNPTVQHSDDKAGLTKSVLAQRRSETFQAAPEIHGASGDDTLHAAFGLVETVEKNCPQQLLVKYMSKSKTFKSKVFPNIFHTA